MPEESQWWESDKVYLKIGTTVLPVEPQKGYSLTFNDYDHIQTTEAGTRVREVIRMNVPTISVNFECDATMLAEMRSYKNLASVTVSYYDPDSSNTSGLLQAIMFVTKYSETMLADTSSGGIWRVSFNLEDLDDV